MFNYCAQCPNLTPHFTVYDVHFQIIEVLGFPIWYNGEFEIFPKKILKIGNKI